MSSYDDSYISIHNHCNRAPDRGAAQSLQSVSFLPDGLEDIVI
jgi:hypothetical protein